MSNPSVESLPLEPVKKPEPVANVAPAKSESSAIARAEPAPALVAPVPVTAPAAQEVYVELQMQGMDMGSSRYRLLGQANGEWRASITLPACVTGRRDWTMVVEVDGTRRAMVFEAG